MQSAGAPKGFQSAATVTCMNAKHAQQNPLIVSCFRLHCPARQPTVVPPDVCQIPSYFITNPASREFVQCRPPFRANQPANQASWPTHPSPPFLYHKSNPGCAQDLCSGHSPIAILTTCDTHTPQSNGKSNKKLHPQDPNFLKQP